MQCMKCGREIKEDGQVFCGDCLTGMAAYPVKPGTPIQLPHHLPPPEPAKVPRRKPRPEDQIASLTRRVKILTIVLCILLVAFAAAATLCFHMLESRRGGESETTHPVEHTEMFHVKQFGTLDYDCFT